MADLDKKTSQLTVLKRLDVDLINDVIPAADTSAAETKKTTVATLANLATPPIPVPHDKAKRVLEIDTRKMADSFTFNSGWNTIYGTNRIERDIAIPVLTEKGIAFTAQTYIGGQPRVSPTTNNAGFQGNRLKREVDYRMGFDLELPANFFTLMAEQRNQDWCNLWQIKATGDHAYTGLLIALFSQPNTGSPSRGPELYFNTFYPDAAGNVTSLNSPTIPIANDRKYRFDIQLRLSDAGRGYYIINCNGVEIQRVTGANTWAQYADGTDPDSAGAARGPYFGIYLGDTDINLSAPFTVWYTNFYIDVANVNPTSPTPTRDNSLQWAHSMRPPKAVKYGQVITPFGDATQIAQGGVINLHAAGITTSPYKYATVCSSDHGGATGPSFYFAQQLSGPWKPWDDVDGEFTTAGFTTPDTTNPITVTDFPVDIPDKGEFFRIYDRGNGTLVLTGHSARAGLSQVQWYATSTDGINWTYGGFIDVPHAGTTNAHRGSYQNTIDIGGFDVINALHVGAGADTSRRQHAQYFRRGSENWILDPRPLEGFSEAYYGLAEYVAPDWQVVWFRNRWWGIGTRRIHSTSGGGGISDGDALIVPISDDFRRAVGPAYFLWERGGSGAFDEADAASGPITAYVDPEQPDRIHFFYTARDASDVGTVGYAYLDPNSLEVADIAWEAQSGYEMAPALDLQGHLLPTHHSGRMKIFDWYAGIDTAIPGWTRTQLGGTVTTTYRLANDAAGPAVYSTATDGAGDIVFSSTQGYNMEKLSELWLTVHNMAWGDQDHGIQIGFTSDPVTFSSQNGVIYFGRINQSASVQPEFRAYAAGVESKTLIPGAWNINHGDRCINGGTLKIGIQRRHITDGTAEKVYVYLFHNDQIIGCRDITSVMTLATIHPYVRCLYNTPVASVDDYWFSFNGLTIEYGPDWRF